MNHHRVFLLFHSPRHRVPLWPIGVGPAPLLMCIVVDYVRIVCCIDEENEKNKLKLHINIVCTMHNAVHSTILRWCASATPAFFQPIALMRTNNEDDDKCFAAQQHDDWRQWVRKFEWAKSNSLIHLAQPPSFCINISIDCFGVCVRACVLWALCKNVQYINNFLFLIHLFCSGRLTWLRPPSAMQPPFVAQKVMNINNAKRLTPYIFSLSRYRPNLFYIFRITGGPWTLQSQLYRHVYFLNINFSGQKKKLNQ